MATASNLLPFRRTQYFVDREAAAAAPARTPDVLLGPSPAIARVWSQIRRVAPYFRMALITGEPGTGAEVVAHTLHSLSPLSARPFTVLHAAEVEAWFAGSTLPKVEGDTLFFAEIEKMSSAAQHGLLRLLKKKKPNQMCVIAAASGDLRPLVSAGTFSGMLASALSALHIALPALRERKEDIPALAAHFFAKESKALGRADLAVDHGFFDALCEAEWVGNIDQLQAVLREMLEKHPGEAPDAALLPELMQALGPKLVPEVEPVRLLKLEQVVQEHIRGVLVRCNGNKLRAAEILGISRSTLYRMLDAQAVTGREWSLAG